MWIPGDANRNRPRRSRYIHSEQGTPAATAVFVPGFVERDCQSRAASCCAPSSHGERCGLRWSGSRRLLCRVSHATSSLGGHRRCSFAACGSLRRINGSVCCRPAAPHPLTINTQHRAHPARRPTSVDRDIDDVQNRCLHGPIDTGRDRTAYPQTDFPRNTANSTACSTNVCPNRATSACKPAISDASAFECNTASSRAQLSTGCSET